MKSLFSTLAILFGVLLIVGGAILLLVFGFNGWGFAGLACIPAGGAMAYFAQKSDDVGEERSAPVGTRSTQDPAESKPAAKIRAGRSL